MTKIKRLTLTIPPLRGPDPKGLIKDKKQDKPIQEKKYGRY